MRVFGSLGHARCLKYGLEFSLRERDKTLFEGTVEVGEEGVVGGDTRWEDPPVKGARLR